MSDRFLFDTLPKLIFIVGALVAGVVIYVVAHFLAKYW